MHLSVMCSSVNFDYIFNAFSAQAKEPPLSEGGPLCRWLIVGLRFNASSSAREVGSAD